MRISAKNEQNQLGEKHNSSKAE